MVLERQFSAQELHDSLKALRRRDLEAWLSELGRVWEGPESYRYCFVGFSMSAFVSVTVGGVC